MRVFSILFVVLSVSASASVGNAEEVVMYVNGARIVVSDLLPPPITSLPAAIKGMSDAQWFEFVQNLNQNQVDIAATKHRAALERGDYPPIVAHVGKYNTSGSSTYRATNGYGVPLAGDSLGGFGGFGGGFGGYGGYGGYGGFTGGSNQRNSQSSSAFDYFKVFKNLNDGGGGPLTLINPYCRDYWMLHAW